MARARTLANLSAAPLLTLLATMATPARGDQLPLATGDWIETRGPWRVERQRVVFTTPEGALRSLPLAEVAPTARSGPVPAPSTATGGARIPEDPWGRVPEIPEPGPLPELPKPPLVRPRVRPKPPICVLANARSEDPPTWICESGGFEPGPERSGTENQAGAEEEMVARGRIELPTP